jgi:uncharacterized repeat protein (TIGR01451 family)
VQNFSDPEISTLQTWLNDLNLSSRVFDQEGLTFTALKKFDLVIWDDLGTTTGGLTANDIAIFTQLHDAGIPLYLIGGKLTASGALLSAAASQSWTILTGLTPAGPTVATDTQVSVQDSLHPVNNGPFGFVGSFTLKTALEHDAINGTGELEVAGSLESVGVLAFEDPSSATRIVTQNFLAVNGGGINASVQREKLFKNAVWWLLNLPPVPPFMNISLDVQGAPDQLKLGQQATLTITIQHTGEIPASGIIVTVALPPNLTLLSSSADNGNCITEDQNVICFLPNLSGADSTTATIVVQGAALGSAEIDAAVSENQAEAILDDNYLQTIFNVVK